MWFGYSEIKKKNSSSIFCGTILCFGLVSDIIRMCNCNPRILTELSCWSSRAAPSYLFIYAARPLRRRCGAVA